MYRIVTILFIASFILSGCSHTNWWPFRTSSNQITTTTPTPLPLSEQVKGVRQDLETKTSKTIPSDAEQTVLRDVTGGTGSGLATRKFTNNKFEHTILADLPEPPQGKHYAAWLVKGKPDEQGFETVSTGKLQ